MSILSLFNDFSYLFPGTPLPTALGWNPAFQRHGDTFYLFGGRASRTIHVNTVYRYNPGSGTWTLLNERMRTGRSEAITMQVRREDFPSC